VRWPGPVLGISRSSPRARAPRSPGDGEYRQLPKTPILVSALDAGRCVVVPAAPPGAGPVEVDPAVFPAAGLVEFCFFVIAAIVRGRPDSGSLASLRHPRAAASGQVRDREGAGLACWSGAGKAYRGRGSNEASEVGSPHRASGRAIIVPARQEAPGERWTGNRREGNGGGRGARKKFPRTLRVCVGTGARGQKSDSILGARTHLAI